MAERANQNILQWLDIDLSPLSSDERKELVCEILLYLNPADLQYMRTFIDNQLKDKLEEIKQEAIAEMRSKLEAYGLKYEDVFPTRIARAKATLKAKYRSADGENSWSGRGFKPVWLRDLEAQGHDIEEFLVKGE